MEKNVITKNKFERHNAHMPCLGGGGTWIANLS